MTNNLRQIRRAKGISIKWVAETSGVNPGIVKRIEDGKNCFANTALALAATLQVPVEALFVLDPHEQPVLPYSTKTAVK